MSRSLTRFAWLSIATAIFTIALKFGAYLLTDSVGLLSDALEGFVNLAAATVALITLRIVEQPPDETHEYGHDKAEYFSSGSEGSLILVAAAGILITSTMRLLDPQPIEQPGLGLAIASLAALLNLIVGQVLLRAGERYDSITLEADGQHLMSDVWTSVGVVVGVTTAVLTGWAWLDPVVAILIGLKIGYEGLKIFRRSVRGLMDAPISAPEREAVEDILAGHGGQGVHWHALRTRQAGGRRFISVHLLVPGTWTVQQAHDLSEELEQKVATAVPRSTLFTHVEPEDDPRALGDEDLDRLDRET
jgi:cation diffusion facilitator family transporter